MWRLEIQHAKSQPFEVLWWGSSSEDVWETLRCYQEHPARTIAYYAAQTINEDLEKR